MTGYLAGINPLAKLAAALPPALALVFVSDIATPAALMILAYVVILTGARLTRTLAIVLFAVIPALVIVAGFSFSLWTSAAKAGGSVVFELGPIAVYSGAAQIGLSTALRLAAILAVSLIAGVSTTGPDVVRSAVQHLGLSYRIGYAALAAFRFVPRFKHELDIIRSAHRVRGRHGGRGPFSAIARWWGYVLPLMAGAIRHAERVALAMDSRAFGAHDTRTERHLVPWRRRDTVFVFTFLAACTALFICAPLAF